MTPLDRALELVEQGYRVFFCGSDKKPTSAHGFHDAANNPEAVFALWHFHPGELVGVVTGGDDPHGIDVLDIDVDHIAARLWWHLNQKRLPETRIHQSRRGGFHVLFRHRPAMRCSASRIAIGVDVRGDGGYIIWWPAAGQPVLCDSPTASWPEWLAELAGPPGRKLVPHPVSRPRQNQSFPKVTNSYGAKALHRARENILRAGFGTQERVIHREAFGIGSLVGAGVVPRATAYEILTGLAPLVPSLNPARPWGYGEVEKKIRRGLELGMANPRSIAIRNNLNGN